MRIIVFNCGSSSLKYRLIDMPSETELAAGEAERVDLQYRLHLLLLLVQGGAIPERKAPDVRCHS